MPSKRKLRGTPVSGEARTTPPAKKAKADHSESEASATSEDEKSFDKGRCMSVMRYNFDDLITRYLQSPALARQIDWVEHHWPDALRRRYITFNKKGQYTLHHTHPKLLSDERRNMLHRYSSGFWWHFSLVPCLEGPEGWIHAVYTSSDSLVFGGNFLHSLRSEMQIQVYLSESINLYVRVSRDVDDATLFQITKKFRFPYIEELMLYVITDFVFKCIGKRYVRPA